MAKMRNKNVRKIENEEEVNSKKTVDTQKSEKTKSKKVTSFGSGEGETQASGKNHQRRKNKLLKDFIFRIPLKMLLNIPKRDIMEQMLMT